MRVGRLRAAALWKFYQRTKQQQRNELRSLNKHFRYGGIRDRHLHSKKTLRSKCNCWKLGKVRTALTIKLRNFEVEEMLQLVLQFWNWNVFC